MNRIKKFVRKIVMKAFNLNEFQQSDFNESEDKFRMLLEFAPEAFFHCDSHGKLLNVNNNALELTGYTRDELLKMNVSKLFEENALERKPLRFDLYKSGKSIKNEREIIRKTGERILVEMNSMAMQDGTFQSFIRDITHRKKAEESIRVSEARLRRAELASKSGNWELHLDTKMIIASEGATKIYGVEKDCLDYSIVKNVPLPEYRSLLDLALKELIEKDRPYDIEFKIKTVDTGEIKDIHSIAIFDKEKRILFGAIQDITQHKLAELALKQSTEQIHAMFQTINDAITFTDMQGIIIDMNDATIRLHGYNNKEELLGKRAVDLIADCDRSKAVENMKKNFDNGHWGIVEYKLVKKDGSEFEAELNATLLKDNQGIPLGFVAISRDITQRKELENQLSDALNYAQVIFEKSPIGIATCKANGDLVSVNQTLAQMAGGTKELLSKLNIYNLKSQQIKEMVKTIDEVLATNKEKNVEIYAQTSFGAEAWVSCFFSPFIYQGEKQLLIMVYDVTDRKQAEAAVQKSSEQWKSTFDGVSDAICILDKDQHILQCNNIMTTIFPERHEREIIGKHCWCVIHGSDVPYAECPIIKMKETLQRERIEINLRNQWHEITVDPILDINKNLTGIVHVMRDITDRRKAEEELVKAKENAEEIGRSLLIKNNEYEVLNEELRQAYEELSISKNILEESEKKFKSYFLNSLDGIFIIDEKGNYLEVNPAASLMTGYEMEELCKMNTSDLLPEFEQENSKERLIAIQETGNFSSENAFLKKDKTLGYWLLNAVKINQNRYLGFAIDITQRRQAEIELIKAKEKAEESEQKYKMLYNSTPVMMQSANIDGNLVAVNDYWLNVMGYELNEVIGTRSSNYLTDWSKKLYAEKIGEFIRTGSMNNLEAQAIKKNGEIIDLLISSKILYGNDGKPIQTMTNLMVITDKKQAERALNQSIEELKFLNNKYLEAKEKAEESDRLKTAFLQNMSHEIRTPMNAIMGFAGLLPRFLDKKAKLEYFSEIIYNRCNDLLEIINDILDIAKIESGQLTTNIENCNLGSLFVELRKFFVELQLRQNKQHISFELKSHSDLKEFVILTDKIKLKQIFINLISNAFKFTEQGKVEGGCIQDENQKLIFYVSDTGIGIPKDKHQYIFERFSQLEKSGSRLYGGTGLGLSIVKGLVDLLGGEVWLESEPDKGTTFYFTINYETTQAKIEESQSIETPIFLNLYNKTILIVEDDFYNAEYLKEVFSNLNLRILLANNGKEAIELSVSQPIDLVFMDIRLPDISGYEAARLIRKSKPKLVIIAQTAYASSDDKQKALDAGCNDYISKPFNKDLLLSLLNKYLH